MNTRTTGTRAAAGAAVLALLVAGAGSSRGADAPSGGPAPAAQAAAPAADQAETCDTDNSRPPAMNANGPTIKEIQNRPNRRLVVGIDLNSFNWGFRDPLDGQIKGFDIDLAKTIAKSILDDENAITLKAVPTAKRVEAVKNREVDMVVRTMTITCDRLKEVDFSAPYFNVSQSLVVPKGQDKPKTVAEGMHGKRVCAAASSSSSTELASGRHATAEVRIVENQLDCLVLMQLGEIDATLADTTLAHAQLAQDPMVDVVEEQIVPAYMGIAMSKEAPDLIAWVNKVLEDYRKGGWQAAYDRWLAPSMGAGPGDSKKYQPW
ncbi:transporter substrate-binding domain-containing protein [Yinghuangia sp. YIM S09857]|uniref:transporter substrate-binding domain-containing protein n=1 Tax=Yinghuangia sp. YIM S09857 TaxID=3436929 RepID=UPI003F536958